MIQTASGPSTESDSAFLGVRQSLTGRFWRARLADDRLALAMSQRLGIPDVVGRVLAARGVDIDEAEAYLNPSLRAALPDPSIFLDMDKAADRVARAITSGETVAVFGDYDVDGATSSALLMRFFQAVGGRLVTYIPDRQAEGYGPNAPALLKLKAQGASLVVTVDCGTTASEPLHEAAAAGLEVIVADHHKAGEGLPEALAIVNPNREDELAGHGYLAAVGVVFLLVIAVNRRLRAAGWYAGRKEPNLLDWLDLVALGTVCDVVPLVGLNRALVVQGLKIMAQRHNVGLAALSDVARMDEAPGTYHAGFLLGPRVNAGGRVGRSELGSRLLSTSDPEEARAIAEELDVLNSERKEIETAVLDAALAQAAEMEMRQGGLGPVMVVAGEGWHQGVIGIVASRLKDKYRRPTMVIALENGRGKGSGRSVPGADLGRAVIAAVEAGILTKGGGHAMAAGLDIEADRIPDLEALLAEKLAPAVQTYAERDSLGFDGAVEPRGATPEMVQLLEQAGPYGSGNAEPRFAVPRVSLVKADIVGKDHVR
ncbi:MAG TPA: single-stranded-DNA-specific exonuclease RecJ, partial [Alphaproteobacteria bacterium]|nr:single-stranded-DNA-specific exonuclease RecJ [Alphaproteobacteria bacterium]